MKILKYINITITILNFIFLVFINTFYFQLPVPNKTYLRDIKVGGNLPNMFVNLAIIGLTINIFFWLIYLFKNRKVLKEKKLSLLTIVVETILIILGIIYQYV